MFVCCDVTKVAIIHKSIYPNPVIKKYLKVNKRILLYFKYLLNFYIEFGNLKILILFQILVTGKSKKLFFPHFQKNHKLMKIGIYYNLFFVELSVIVIVHKHYEFFQGGKKLCNYSLTTL
jgi:hypothetical protein